MHSGNVVAAWVLAAHDRLAEGMAEARLDSRELAALTLVATHDGRSLEWLRSRVGLTQSGTVRLVDRLAGRGLLQRGSSHGRGVPLHVTAAGAQLLERWSEVRDELVESVLAGLSGEQREALVGQLAAALRAEERTRPRADATCRTCSWPLCGPDCPVDRSVAPTGET